MPDYAKYWSDVKDEVADEVKSDKEAASYLKALYKKFNADLTAKIKACDTAKTSCDSYEAHHHAMKTAADYRDIIKKSKDWPDGLDDGKEKLDAALKKIEEKTQAALTLMLTTVQNRADKVLPNWSDYRSTNTVLKGLDAAVTKWNKATGGKLYSDLLELAKKNKGEEARKLLGKHLHKMADEMQEAAQVNVAKQGGENRLLAECLTAIGTTALQYRDNLAVFAD